jgi:hypothetical protein
LGSLATARRNTWAAAIPIKSKTTGCIPLEEPERRVKAMGA